MEFKKKWLRVAKEMNWSHFDLDAKAEQFQRMRLNKDEKVKRKSVKGK